MKRYLFASRTILSKMLVADISAREIGYGSLIKLPFRLSGESMQVWMEKVESPTAVEQTRGGSKEIR